MARELKYHSPTTDLAALQRELTGSSLKSDDDEPDEYAEFADGDEGPDADAADSADAKGLMPGGQR